MIQSTSISIDQLTQQLRELGVASGGVLLVHCAFSKVKPIEHGPDGLIAALQAAVGPSGTLVMPSMSDDDDQPFDSRTTPCRHLGVVANTFCQLPEVLRSDSPHAFAARGPEAARITQLHPLDVPHGLDSPVGRIYEMDGQVLLLVDAWLETEPLQRKGRVGHADARRLRSRDIVRVVVQGLQREETMFLHPIGVDEQCDEARASLRSSQQ